jgi:membrane-bound metal-dependent hydrolase YbcI (DUF457 family)
LKWKTHISLGIFTGLIICIAGYDLRYIIFSAFFSIIADIDKLGSKVGRLFFPFSLLLIPFKHRGITHSIWPIIIMLFLPVPINLFTIAGFASHMLLDGISGKIKPFHPFGKSRGINLILVEPVVFISISLTNIFLILAQI